MINFETYQEVNKTKINVEILISKTNKRSLLVKLKFLRVYKNILVMLITNIAVCTCPLGQNSKSLQYNTVKNCC